MPSKRAPCQICRENESKYTCSRCMVVYCSVSCFKQHKGTCIRGFECLDTAPDQAIPPQDEPPLRPLTSLKWPYIPEESAYPDPLKRDDPKQLQIHQYESIATSQNVRKVLASHPKLRDLLRSIDNLRGEDREEALQRALGISPSDLDGSSRKSGTYAEEDVKALRELAEAIEAAVRGGKEDVLGLDWAD
ncbi:hypothetical protein BDW22DRAFT_1409646 [Trametopsis cervina]|nr:hypothetical protein BDW22DRAFT_1409646 [Trametopsis cervina]